MKNIKKSFGIIAFIALIIFGMAACDDGSTANGGGGGSGGQELWERLVAGSGTWVNNSNGITIEFIDYGFGQPWQDTYLLDASLTNITWTSLGVTQDYILMGCYVKLNAASFPWYQDAGLIPSQSNIALGNYRGLLNFSSNNTIMTLSDFLPMTTLDAQYLQLMGTYTRQ